MRVAWRGAPKLSRSRARRQSPLARLRQGLRQKAAQFLLCARRGGAIVVEAACRERPAAGVGGIVEQMRRRRAAPRAALRARRLRGGELPQSSAGVTVLAVADQDERRDLQRLALAIGAGRIIGGHGARRAAARRRGRDAERDVAALREADRRRAAWRRRTAAGEEGERRRGVGGPAGKSTEHVSFTPRGANSSILEGDVTPARQRRGEGGAVLRQAEAGMDQRDRGKRPCPCWRRQIAAQRPRRPAQRRRGSATTTRRSAAEAASARARGERKAARQGG